MFSMMNKQSTGTKKPNNIQYYNLVQNPFNRFGDVKDEDKTENPPPVDV